MIIGRKSGKISFKKNAEPHEARKLKQFFCCCCYDYSSIFVLRNKCYTLKELPKCIVVAPIFVRRTGTVGWNKWEVKGTVLWDFVFPFFYQNHWWRGWLHFCVWKDIDCKVQHLFASVDSSQLLRWVAMSMWLLPVVIRYVFCFLDYLPVINFQK